MQRAAAGDLLRALGIPLHDPSRSVRTLSGGQRQLLAVARAMSWKPQLLILDEPTASLGVTEAAQVEGLITSLRLQGTTILLVSHDIEQMFRLADRIVVLRHGRVVGDVRPDSGHPDEVTALVSGQQVDSSARRQLTRLHGLADRLASADPSSSLSLILSALGAALGTERLCIHLLERPETLACAASLGLPPALLAAWSRLGYGPAGGPVGLAAATAEVVVDDNVRASADWAPFRELARAAKVSELVGGAGAGAERADRRDHRVPAGHRAARSGTSSTWCRCTPAMPRARSSGTGCSTRSPRATGCWRRSREMLETLAGPIPVPEGLARRAAVLRRGLQADEVALVSRSADGAPRSRAHAGSHHPGRLSAAGGRHRGPGARQPPTTTAGPGAPTASGSCR